MVNLNRDLFSEKGVLLGEDHLSFLQDILKEPEVPYRKCEGLPCALRAHRYLTLRGKTHRLAQNFNHAGNVRSRITLAYDLVEKKLVAFKRIYCFSWRDHQFAKNEIECLTAVKGATYCLQLLHVTPEIKKETKTVYGFFTEYYRNGDLHSILYKRPLTEEQQKMLLPALIKAGIELHERKIYHRDLKLENIMVPTSFDQPKIIDFGLACKFTDTEERRITLGSLLYCAPEILMLDKSKRDSFLYTTKADVYSIAMVIYGAVFRRSVPFSLLASQEKFRDFHDELERFHKDEPEKGSFKHLFWRMAAPNPSERPDFKDLEIPEKILQW